MKKIILMLMLAYANCSFAQYHAYYPIGEDADVNYKFRRYHHSEKILFEANPMVRYSFFNSIHKNLTNGENKATAYYLAFRPQLRMYNDNSKPVRMPSYKIMLIATQQMWRIKDKNFLTVAFESGHYSNGQDRSSFSELYKDESEQGDSIYTTITDDTNLSDLLNRSSGNYSTNLSELIVNYRINVLDTNCIPKTTHSFKVGAVVYHDRLLGLIDIGGYSGNDIKLYGYWRVQAGYSFTTTLRNSRRLSASADLEIITGAHPHVNPLRHVVKLTYFPFLEVPQFGFYADYITGHDNYNFRFVDSGDQFSLGILWHPFGVFSIQRGENGCD
jgi:hypothetical protein